MVILYLDGTTFRGTHYQQSSFLFRIVCEVVPGIPILHYIIVDIRKANFV